MKGSQFVNHLGTLYTREIAENLFQVYDFEVKICFFTILLVRYCTLSNIPCCKFFYVPICDRFRTVEIKPELLAERNTSNQGLQKINPFTALTDELHD